MTNRFTGHPIGVARSLGKAKARTRDEREQRCIDSLLCGLTDDDLAMSTKVEAVYHVSRKSVWDRLTDLSNKQV